MNIDHLGIEILNRRYIQGARFFGNSNIGSSSSVPVTIDLPISEAGIVTDTNASTSNASTFRARFVGQGYKQVVNIFAVPYIEILCYPLVPFFFLLLDWPIFLG